MTEDWRPIDGCIGYEVSNLGRVRSWRKRGFGAGQFLSEPIIMRVEVNHANYERVMLRKGDKPHRRAVHQLVLEAFVGPRPSDKHHGAHGDGNRRNNTLENLRWALPTENESDKERHGTKLKGESVYCSILTEEAVREIRNSNEGLAELGNKYGVTRHAVWRVRHGKSWRHVA